MNILYHPCGSCQGTSTLSAPAEIEQFAFSRSHLRALSLFEAYMHVVSDRLAPDILYEQLQAILIGFDALSLQTMGGL